MLFSQNEKQLLAIIYGLSANKIKTDYVMIEKGGREFFKNGFLDMNPAFSSLKEKRLIIFDDDAYILIHQGSELGAEFLAEFINKGFSNGLARFEQSNAFKKYCKELYGRDLGQLSLLTENQLNYLTEALKHQKPSTVLDLGCGLGGITAYLAEQTGVSFTGVDFAEDAIISATEKHKQNDIKFICQDFNHLNFPVTSFDAIIAIDTLYFANNLEDMIKTLKEMLKPQGKLYLYYSCAINTNNLSADQYSQHTKLAEILHKHKFKYQTVDYSLDEFIYWNNVLEVGEPLTSEFEADGSRDLLDQLLNEARVNLEPNALTRVRYLYEARI